MFGPLAIRRGFLRQAMGVNHIDAGNLAAVAMRDPMQRGKRRLGRKFGVTRQMFRIATRGCRRRIVRNGRWRTASSAGAHDPHWAEQ
jgi:hypothetical protein